MDWPSVEPIGLIPLTTRRRALGVTFTPKVYAYAASNPLSRIDPYGLASIEAATAEAIASGNVEALESLLEAADADQAKIIQAAIKRLTSTADQIISNECKASVRSEFPKSVLNNTLQELKELARSGDKESRTALKLLNDLRFKK